MPFDFNWLDVVIALLLLLAVVQGVRAGLIRSIFTILGIAAGLTAAVNYYALAGSALAEVSGLPQFIADAICFILVFSAAALAVHLAGSVIGLVTRLSPFRLINRVGGSAAGLIIGLALIGVLLILFTAFPIYAGFQEHIDRSYLAPPIIGATQEAYDEFAEFIPVELPGIKVFPEELDSFQLNINSYDDHGGVDFRSLEDSTCFACGDTVEFNGFLANGKGSVSPRFTCRGCGRTSDGCQTYEGYHAMYDRCPVDLGNQGYRLDCGIWTNHSYHRPTGPCPECGAE